MAERKSGKVIYRKALSPMLELFRMVPQDGTPFPPYRSGQYIALSRDNCRLTKKVASSSGQTSYVYDLDESGKPKRGTVTHSYSISSAPSETLDLGFLEFYVVLEMVETGDPGRLSESLFQIDPDADSRITYVNKIVGDFTLEQRAAGMENVVMVGTGTGLAPFASMVKQLYREALEGKADRVRYTLVHANRTFNELGYHAELREIEAAHKFDFLYLPSVSRPTARDLSDTEIGKGRANNILRKIFDMPMKEEQKSSRPGGGDVQPLLPARTSAEALRGRMNPSRTVILTCGNPLAMEDIRFIAEAQGIRFEKEDW